MMQAYKHTIIYFKNIVFWFLSCIYGNQAPELSEATGSKDIYDQQTMEGSMEEAEDKFQYNEMHNEDTDTEIRESHDTSLPYEVNQVRHSQRHISNTK